MLASEGRIAGVVFAAGASTRMGQNKLLLPLSGESLVHRTVRQAIEAGLDPVLVVQGRDAERIQEAVADLACQSVYNPDYAEGMSTSFRVGIGSLSADVEAALFMLADQPFVTTAMIRQVMETYRERESPLVVCYYGDVQAPPHLWHRDYFSVLSGGRGDQGAKQFINQYLNQAAVISFPPEALFDIDDPKDYERAKALVEGS